MREITRLWAQERRLNAKYTNRLNSRAGLHCHCRIRCDGCSRGERNQRVCARRNESMLGYRAFKVLVVNGEKRVYSVYKTYHYSPGRLEAECDPAPVFAPKSSGELPPPEWPEPCPEVPGKHPVDGGCGFYFYRASEAAEITLKWLPNIVYGLVWASGRMVEHTDGVWRSQYLQILALAGPDKPDFDVPFFACANATQALEALEAAAREFEPDAL